MLELKNISYCVGKGNERKIILNNINFKCLDNQTIAITGHNGSGKSTLLKIIMGIIKPTSGEIFFNKKNITDFKIHERAKLGIAYSFQTPVCFKGLSVQSLIELAQNNENKSVASSCRFLSKLGICAREYLNREVDNKLSGGEQKRIDIASVLARCAKLNLFDEPEAGIDIWSFDSLVETFLRIKSANIIVSHQKRLLEKADKIIVLDKGEIVSQGEAISMIKNLGNSSFCSKLGGDNGQA